jgi:hypothetical protein
MGTYTELILGARLKEKTPIEVIEILSFMIGERESLTSESNFYLEQLGLDEDDLGYILYSSSYYFGVSETHSVLLYDEIIKCYHISLRSNCKNYENQIERFLKWLKPYIDKGSGKRDMYAIVTLEDAMDSDIYYLNELERKKE